MILLMLLLLFSCLDSLTEANSMHLPRMVITDKEITMRRLPLPDHHAPVRIVLEREPDKVIIAGQKRLTSFDFQSPQKSPVVLWEDCINSELSKTDCSYNITVVHKMTTTTDDNKQVFLCGTNGRQTTCCDMDLSEKSPRCVPSDKMKSIKESIKGFIIKEGEQSVLVESEGNADLYITYSGSREYGGIYRFGRNGLQPASPDGEQHYVGLMVSRQGGLQDKVYAFYKEKNRDNALYSEMWLPFVTQVCMADRGGRKNTLQSTWTSQMNARLFCGDPDSKQHFSELVDVATVHAGQWQDTTVYALFRNEWGMSAVCVYTIQDIDHVFQTSPFKGGDQRRTRMCVRDSTQISLEDLGTIKKTSEMEQLVWPVNRSGPILFNHHIYTHIYVDSSHHKRNNHPVLFLSLNNGGIHKMIKNKGQSFVIAEYRPFNYKAHILGIVLHPTSRTLYVNNRDELVQLDVANCVQYGDRCEECVLARDPYCGWNGAHCTADGIVQDVARGNYNICSSTFESHGKALRYYTDAHENEDVNSIRLPPNSKYFLQCPVSSLHAQYTWHHLKSSTSCSSREHQCLHLIDSMGPEQVGTYECVSEEMGYSRVLAQYQLQLESRAVGHSSSLLVWVCLVAFLLRSLSC
ncbi:semaphorin-7A [Chaetodon trifascialis]|uniref:semaphorin-7A n=1 Tax=Chaetodon trifascialis TaxID=109706 RepID=UPI003994F28C